MRYSLIAKKGDGYVYMNPFENTIAHHGDIQPKVIYVSWEPINKGRVISLKKISGSKLTEKELCERFNTDDILWATYKASVVLQDDIAVRMDLFKEFKVNCMNLNKSELALHVISKLWEKYFDSIPELQSRYDTVAFDTIIRSNVNTKLITEVKRAIKTHGVIDFKGLTLKYGEGGVHAAKKGVHECEPYEKIISVDVNAFYASLIKGSKYTPHFVNQDKFRALVNDLIERKQNNKFYKFVLTYLYGNICSNRTWLWNPLLQMDTVINGQLILTELLENVCKTMSIVPLIVNTDEIVIRMPNSRTDDIDKIVNDWCDKYGLTVKTNVYSKMVIRDVNNYIAIGPKTNVSKEIYSDMKSIHPEYYFETLGPNFYVATVKYKGVYRYLPKGLQVNPQADTYLNVAYWYLYGIENDDIKDIVNNVRRPLDVKQLEMFA